METIKAKENIYLGRTTDAQEAREKAEKLFIDKIGEEDYEEQKPYNVDYDSERKMWKVYGTIKERFWPHIGVLGSVISIIINEEDGKVIALWYG